MFEKAQMNCSRCTHNDVCELMDEMNNTVRRWEDTFRDAAPYIKVQLSCTFFTAVSAED